MKKKNRQEEDIAKNINIIWLTRILVYAQLAKTADIYDARKYAGFIEELVTSSLDRLTTAPNTSSEGSE